MTETDNSGRIYPTEKDRIKALNTRQLKRLIDGTTIPENKEIYQRYINSYRIAGASVYTIRNHLSSLLVWDKIVNADYQKMTYTDVENALVALEDTDQAEGTKKKHQIILKIFLRFVGRTDLTDRIKIKINKRSKLPEQLLTSDDIDQLIKSCLNARDKACISLLYESGARLGEILSMKIKHLEPHEKGMYVQFPEGKTGSRKIMVIYSAMHLNQWITSHPDNRNSEAPLWCKLGGNHEVLTVAAFRQLITAAAKRAGITKPVNPHAFRHAQATELAKDFTEQTLKRYLGWTADSKMAATYVHLASKDVDQAVLKRAGIEIEERDTRLKMDECPRCHKLITPDVSFCGFCGLPLTQDAQTIDETAQNNITDMLKNPEVMAMLAQKLLELQK